MKKLLGIFAVSALTILGCTTAFASNSVQGDADTDGILTAKDSAYVLQKTLDSTFKVPMADEEYSVYCDVNGDKVVNADDASLILQKVLNDSVKFAPIGGSTETTTETTTATTTETTTVTTTETTTQVTTEGTTEETTIPDGFNTVPENFDYTVNVSNFSELKSALSDCAKKSGQKAIYITDDINATEQIKLATSNANISLIGVEKADGSYPAIDFAKFRDSKNSTGENGTGIYVSKGSYYNFKNLIVKNAPDCGMRIKNSNSGNCIVQNCVFKYNNNSGISVTAGGHDNTFIGVDSYRNCDLVQKLGSDADGFSVKLNAGKNNKFFACRAWENGDDGWDSYNYSGDSPYHLDYIECLCYHNGDYDIYNGKWDYENNLPLDKDLLYVQAMIKADPDFEAKYNNRQLDVNNWPNITLTKFGKSIKGSDISYENWDGNPNGFKFGSKYTTSASTRTVKNCIAFNNGQKGFDENNSKATIDMENTIAFDNGFKGKKGQSGNSNYRMELMNIQQFENCFGFNGAIDDFLPEGKTVITPDASTQDAVRNATTALSDSLQQSIRENKIPGIVWFNDIFALTK